MMDVMYCVTARSRLSGGRDRVTPPCSKRNAVSICNRLKATVSGKRDYLYPKVEPYWGGVFEREIKTNVCRSR